MPMRLETERLPGQGNYGELQIYGLTIEDWQTQKDQSDDQK